MKKKRSIVVLCGGRSAEHEISLISTRKVISQLNPERFITTVIYLSQEGHWYRVDPRQKCFESQKDEPVYIVPGEMTCPFKLKHTKTHSSSIPTDCVLPMLHGPFGEDGTIQGLLEILAVPYIGSSVLGSALCIQKSFTKRLLQHAGLPVPNWIDLNEKTVNQWDYHAIAKQLGDVFFIKPCCLGSSIGISKIRNAKEYCSAIKNAFQYDSNIIAESYVEGREIECSVLGNDQPAASLPGEIVHNCDFYSYEAKYIEFNKVAIITPAQLTKDTVHQIQKIAIEAFKVLNCLGMARIDFFLQKNQNLWINEVNTIPGFTNISMYPKNWEATGLSFTHLLEKLIQLALEQHHKKMKLSFNDPKHTEPTDLF